MSPAAASGRARSAPRAAPPQPAYLLHRHDWSESSLILDLLGRDEGRVVLVAKGAKRPHSNFRTVLLPLQRLLVVHGRRKPQPLDAQEEGGEVLPLKSAEWAGGPPLPQGQALLAGFYLNELLLKLLPRHDPHPRLFDAYALTVAALGERPTPPLAPLLRAFELLLLRELGLLPALDHDTLRQRPLADADPAQPAALRPEAGLVLLPPGDEGPERAPPALPAAQWCALEAALQALAPQLGGIEPPAGAAVQAAFARLQAGCAAPALRPLLRGVLHYHLGGRPLHTRQLMADLATAP
ncbi:DNA repair protein RecO C-terminal domain-containing protein [Piscinibacter sp. Jin2]|uniref:DNA repair protein RecO n=1 Tax=Aquariibacter lacus TaxID=2801332 RepID=A0A9X0XIL9_9BURK|nr:DNA repair protein RecO C-terminal domain-containing protein [Piscinibacter lacus]MBL0720658.1 DNA repair protein RecO C-terminal domain-containing protein [Piscinibacter lacus]